MFGQFTKDAREVVVRADTEARGLGHGWIGTEHLVIALAAAGTAAGLDVPTARADVLRVAGAADDALDADALATLGIDLGAVRERVEAAFGPGALSRGRRPCPGRTPFSAQAKKAFELAVREAVALRSKDIRAEHLLLGVLLEGEGPGARILAAHGVRTEDVRARLAARDAA